MLSSIRRSALWGLCLLLAMTIQSQAEDESPTESTNAKVPIPEKEKPFRENAQKFVDAYAKRDAEAIGRLFTEDAEFLDELKVRTVGRKAIVNRFRDAFADPSHATFLTIQIDKITYLSDDAVLEEGFVVVEERENQSRFYNRYVAIHTRGDDGHWRIKILKDYPREPLGRMEQLARLSWLLGDWINEDSASTVVTTCRWSEDGNYLLRKFQIRTDDGRELNGTQRIGWDPVRQKLRSWTFDSAGGFFSGFWTQTDDGWILTSAGVTASGETTSSTAIYKIIDQEMLTWQYTNLIIGETVHGAGNIITMVRRPPEPKLPAEPSPSKD